MGADSNPDVARAMFASYVAQDRAAAERLIAEDFVFTSPQDDHIDKAAFFERCFPTADRVSTQELHIVVPAGDDDVFVLYEYELRVGGRYRNAELITVRGGRIVETQVFFGGRVPDA
ncbi:MAG TPA: nuclear transport factor 2 family protein [Aldersonia sp.]